MRDNGPTVVLLAALLAIFGFRSYSPDDAAPVKNELKGNQLEAAPSGEKGPNGAGGTLPPPSEETLGPSWPSFDFQNTNPGPANVSDPDNLCLDVPGWDTRYLIACVPDPHDSSSGYRFDYLIDAIQLAAEAQHFVLDRYFYPWSPKKPAFDIQGTLTQKKSDKREIQLAALSKPSQSKGRTDPRQWPGLLLFRESPRNSSAFRRPRLRQVFLVGETATAGIHKRAFAASLDLIAKSEEYKRERTVRILGPYFSGSQASLERTLQEWALPRVCCPEGIPIFTITSGEATAIDKTILKENCWPAQVEFRATFIPEKEVLKATLDYLGVIKESRGQMEFNKPVAFVGESNTTFGKTMGSDFSESKSQKCQPAYFPFPLHISEVRSAYQQTSGPTKNDFQSLPSFGSKLRLPLASSQPRDVEPSQDHAMTAVATERILGNMLNTIAGERIPYTIILASDVKDKLFLVTLLRQHCPETRLILSGNDLLFSHPDFSAALRGTIVGSTYPLYPRNQHWSFPAKDAKHRHLLFPSEEAQGYYNAAIALLNEKDPSALLNEKDSNSLLEYGPPFPKLQTEKDDLHRPPVWVSIIGQGGPVPLTAIPIQDKQSVEYVMPWINGGAGEWAFRPLHPTLWTVLVPAITILLIYVFFSYFAALWGRDHKWKSYMGKEMQELFRPRKGGPGAAGFRWRQRLYTFSCLTSVSVLYAYLTFVWLIPFFYWCKNGELVEMEGTNLFASIILASLLLLIAAAFAVLWVIPLSWWPSAPIRFSILVALLLLIMAISVVHWNRGPSFWVPVGGWLWVRVLLCLLIPIVLFLLFSELFLALNAALAQRGSQFNQRFRLPFVGGSVNRCCLLLVGVGVNLLLLNASTH